MPPEHYGRQTRVLYCDIDGTLRHGKDELGRFVNKYDDVVVFDGVKEILRTYRRHGWRVVGISNQGGIALGHVTRDDVRTTMTRTNDLCGNYIDFISICEHHPAAADPTMAACWCRKPRAGLVIEAAIYLGRHFRESYPPYMSLYVGDRREDRDCAAAANVYFMDARVWRDWPTHPIEPPLYPEGKCAFCDFRSNWTSMTVHAQETRHVVPAAAEEPFSAGPCPICGEPFTLVHAAGSCRPKVERMKLERTK